MPRPVSQEFLDNLGRTLEQGVAMHRAGLLDEAEKIYARILKNLPDQFDALLLMAQLKMARGKAGEAHRLTMAAVTARPDSADALVALGHILRLLKRDDEALAHFDKALSIAPGHIDALGMRGDALNARGRANEALHCFDKILALAPGHRDARANRGTALAKLERYEEALAEFDAVLSQVPQQASPQNAMVAYNRANALASLGRYAESLSAYDRMLAGAPQHALAWNNRGNVLMALKRHAEAVESFSKAIEVAPDLADAYFNRSLAQLAIGNYARGFADYEWRWKRFGMPAIRPNYGRPLWLGEFPLERKTILIHSEQGLGDCIQFARYIPVLARAGAKVVLEVQPELKSLLSRIAGVSQIFARGEPLPPLDVQCPVGSLPLANKTLFANVPADIPYLTADEGRVSKWRPRLETLKNPRVAFAWAGNASHANDRNRSLTLAQIKPIWEGGKSSFVSLQRELRPADAGELKKATDVLHLGGEFADLDDTAAVIALCDLVISVDTSVAHLAAAMGRPVWVLLPFSPDWRWTLESEASPWYPAARLFRQPQLGDWAGVVERVRGELAKLGNASV
jgi:tetratricopeptide (TPR) repeat protein